MDAKDLPINTWYVQTLASFDDGPGVQDSYAVVLSHYRVAGSVPEPGSADLLLGGVVLLRAMRRVAGRARFVRGPGDGAPSGNRRRRSRRASLDY